MDLKLELTDGELFALVRLEERSQGGELVPFHVDFQDVDECVVLEEIFVSSLVFFLTREQETSSPFIFIRLWRVYIGGLAVGSSSPDKPH